MMQTGGEREKRLRLVTVTAIQNAKMRNPQGESLGKIVNYVLDLNSGYIIYAVLAHEGISGDKFYAVPWTAMTPVPSEGAFAANIRLETLENTAGFNKNSWPKEGNWKLIEKPQRPAEISAKGRWPITVEVVEPVIVPGPPPQTEVYATTPPPERARAGEGSPPTTVAAARTVRPGKEPVLALQGLTTAELQSYLKDIHYPTGKQNLMDAARENQAPPLVMEALSKFEYKQYASATEVSWELERIKFAPETVKTEGPKVPPVAIRVPSPSFEVRQPIGEISLEHLGAADLQVYLKGMDYPADREDLIRHARALNAPPSVEEALQRFEDKNYRSAAEVGEEFGKIK
ncbi:MAG TPA: DUF2795 domain-containing protein [Methanomicrobiales archaeon]|nr:DUF2795 domain-containing protein [Methanomicrobiales archaeon]